jgi:hypothetical protein
VGLTPMHKVIFYPVGNGDTSQIILANGKRILLDYRHRAATEQDDEGVFNLNEKLLEELKNAGRDSFDVVAFTHADSDHIGGSTEFFELEHAVKYQGGGRIKIHELWVPAAMVIEECAPEDRSEEFVILRQEARHRLREGRGIRVFSKPEKLKKWFDENGIDLDSRRDLIVDAGKTVPGLSLGTDGVEFFCHSPFIKHVDGGDDLRNPCSLIFNIRFDAGGTLTDYLAVGDSEFDVLEDIVTTTRVHGNMDRLAWDLFNIPHHCSYRALSDDKGAVETVPKPLVEELLMLGRRNAYIVSSSHPIGNDDAAHEQQMPPHVQAKKAYKRYLDTVGGSAFLVTMEEPSKTKPEPIVFTISVRGLAREKNFRSAAAVLTSSPAPRAG